MSCMRVFHLATSALFGVYLCQSVSNEWHNNILKINIPSSDPYCRDNALHLNLYAQTYNSILEKWRNNVFKVNARLVESNGEEDDSDEEGIGPDTDPPDVFNAFFHGNPLLVVGAVGPMPTCALIKYDRESQTKSYISYYDYVVACDTSKKTPFYAMQGVTTQTANLLQHRHCESFKIAVQDKPDDYYFGKEGCNEKLTIKHIEPAGRRIECGQYVCDFCNYSNFWEAFNKYIRFLTGMYSLVYVCSGPLFLKGADECPGTPTEHQKPSHFFKVVLCQNDAMDYRMECYIIENKPMTGAIPDIRNFVVSREELQGRSRMTFFPKLPNRMIKDNTPHSAFFPARLARPKLRAKRRTTAFDPNVL